jgi:hypothetical protein
MSVKFESKDIFISGVPEYTINLTKISLFAINVVSYSVNYITYCRFYPIEPKSTIGFPIVKVFV